MAKTHAEFMCKFIPKKYRAAVERRSNEIILGQSCKRVGHRTTVDVHVLIDLVADFEKRTNQALYSSKVSAADLVRHRLDERGMSVGALARLIGVPQSNLSEMLAGKRDWSKAAIRGLAAQFNIRTDRFLL